MVWGFERSQDVSPLGKPALNLSAYGPQGWILGEKASELAIRVSAISFGRFSKRYK